MWVEAITLVVALYAVWEYIKKLYIYQKDYETCINASPRKKFNVHSKRDEANQKSSNYVQTAFQKNLNHTDPPPPYEEVIHSNKSNFSHIFHNRRPLKHSVSCHSVPYKEVIGSDKRNFCHRFDGRRPYLTSENDCLSEDLKPTAPDILKTSPPLSNIVINSLRDSQSSNTLVEEQKMSKENKGKRNSSFKKSELSQDDCAPSNIVLNILEKGKGTPSAEKNDGTEKAEIATDAIEKGKGTLSAEKNDGTEKAEIATDAKKRSESLFMANEDSVDTEYGEDPNAKTETDFLWQINGRVKREFICFMGIINRCRKAESAEGCNFLHARLPYQWQFGKDEEWFNFHPKHSDDLERKFRDPDCESTNLQKLDNHLALKNLKGILSLLGAESVEVDFIKKTVQNEESKETFSIRHITTVSSAISDSKFSTKFVWYLKKKGSWHIVDSRFTKVIEKAYLRYPSGTVLCNYNKSTFNIDFQNMRLHSLTKGKEMNIRRRPAPFKT